MPVATLELPTLSLHKLHDELSSRRQGEATRALGASLETFGFVAITDHDVEIALLDQAYALARTTFALPTASKRRYETPEDGRQRGYTSVGVEHAKDHPTPDLKEFWHVGRDEHDPPNVFPEVEGFATTFRALFKELDRVATRLLGAIGFHLQLPQGYFEDMTRNGGSVVRVIHYPPLHAQVPQGAVRAAAHEDINLLTVLPVAKEPGLELQTREGQWLAVHPPPNVMLCDTGDMMQLLTRGRMRSTTHRVVNPSSDANLARYSMPFFCHPRGDAVLRPAVDDKPAITADAFLMDRLREIGVA